MKIIKQIAAIVEKACAQESNIFGYNIWTHHIVRVAALGKELCPLFGADPEIVEIAALLHDYASVKSKELYADHDIHGPLEAERILVSFNYPRDKIEQVKECIKAHRANSKNERTTPEAICLANADACAHIEQVPSLLYLAFMQHRMKLDEGTIWVRNKLERTWQKLSPDVQQLWRSRYLEALNILSAPNVIRTDNDLTDRSVSVN